VGLVSIFKDAPGIPGVGDSADDCLSALVDVNVFKRDAHLGTQLLRDAPGQRHPSGAA